MNIQGRPIEWRLANHSWFLGGMFLLKVALDTAYLIYVQPTWAYMGFGAEVSLLRYLEGWVLFGMTLPVLSPVMTRPSDFFVLFLVATVVTPMTSMFGLTAESRLAMYSVLAGLWVVCLFRSGRPVRFPTVRFGVPAAIVLSLGATVAVIAWLFGSGGTQLMNFDITAVYDFRGAQDELINRGIFPYLNVWVFKVFNVFLLAWALHRRYWLVAAGVVLLQLFFFGVSNHKAVILYPFIVLFIWFFFRRTQSLVIVPFAIVGLILFSGLLWYSMDVGRLASLFIRRALFVIANNTFDYYDFFSTHAHVFWTNSFLSSFANYPYHLSPPELIGEWRGNPGHVNNTFLSTGFMHAGLLGLALYSMAVGLLFRVVDSLALQAGPIWFALAVTLIPIQHLLSSADLLTALLSHGIAVNVMLLFLSRRRRLGRQHAPRPDIGRSVGREMLGTKGLA